MGSLAFWARPETMRMRSGACWGLTSLAPYMLRTILSLYQKLTKFMRMEITNMIVMPLVPPKEYPMASSKPVKAASNKVVFSEFIIESTSVYFEHMCQ